MLLCTLKRNRIKKDKWSTQLAFILWIKNKSIILTIAKMFFSVYIDMGNQPTDSSTLSFAFTTTSTTRNWEIKVSQIECSNPGRWVYVKKDRKKEPFIWIKCLEQCFPKSGPRTIFGPRKFLIWSAIMKIVLILR